MNRLAILAMAGALIAAPAVSFAQHGGHGRPSSKDNEENAKVITNLHYALAMQASPDQIPQFKTAAGSIETARKKAEQIQQKASSLDSDVSTEIKNLTAAIEQAKSDNDVFTRNFSNAQKSGLKDFLKKMSKTDSEITKLSRELNQTTDKARLGDSAGKLEKALSTFQKQQADLAAEMGIQS